MPTRRSISEMIKQIEAAMFIDDKIPTCKLCGSEMFSGFSKVEICNDCNKKSEGK
jgi:hypothetical protein